MQFENPIIGEEELIRSAIKSENYDPGVTGWRIARDGSAEFTDLLLTFLNAGGKIVFSDGKIQMYDSKPVPQLVVEISPLGVFSIRSNPSGVIQSINYVALTDSSIEWNNYPRPDLVTQPGIINWETASDGGSPAHPADPVQLTLRSGYVKGTGTPDGVQVTLQSIATSSGANRPKVTIDGDQTGAGNGCDLDVTGRLTHGNLQSGSTTHTFSNVSTVDVSVTFSPAFDGVPNVQCTMGETGSLNSGTSSMIVRFFNKTASGMTIRVNDTGGTLRTTTVHVDWRAEY
jgi:hypothetical protein